MNTTLGNGTEPISTSCYLGCAFTSVSILGLVGNILVIFSISWQYFYKNAHYYIVFHLAVCDLLNSFIALSHGYKWLTGERWTTSIALFRLMIFHRSCFTAGVFFMVFMPLLRAVCYPLRTPVTRWKLHYLWDQCDSGYTLQLFWTGLPLTLAL